MAFTDIAKEKLQQLLPYVTSDGKITGISGDALTKMLKEVGAMGDAELTVDPETNQLYVNGVTMASQTAFDEYMTDVYANMTYSSYYGNGYFGSEYGVIGETGGEDFCARLTAAISMSESSYTSNKEDGIYTIAMKGLVVIVMETRLNADPPQIAGISFLGLNPLTLESPTIDIIPPYSKRNGGTDVKQAYKYFKYEIVKSYGGDIVIKCFLDNNSTIDEETIGETFNNMDPWVYTVQPDEPNVPANEWIVTGPRDRIDGTWKGGVILSQMLDVTTFLHDDDLYGAVFMGQTAPVYVLMAGVSTKITSEYTLVGASEKYVHKEVTSSSSDPVILGAFFCPGSKLYRSRYSRWIVMGGNFGFYELSLGGKTYRCDHGVCTE